MFYPAESKRVVLGGPAKTGRFSLTPKSKRFSFNVFLKRKKKQLITTQDFSSLKKVKISFLEKHVRGRGRYSRTAAVLGGGPAEAVAERSTERSYGKHVHGCGTKRNDWFQRGLQNRFASGRFTSTKARFNLV